MLKTRENTNKLLKFISEKFVEGELDNESLVQIIELCGDYLNLKTISDYARAKGMNYNGAKKPTKQRRIKQIFGVKFVIDNV